MGSHKEDQGDTANFYCKRCQGILKTWIACLGSFSISIVGGLILTWWELRFHPTNRQLWMVPFGLILFITPVIVWLSLCISYMFNNPADSHSNSNPSPGEETCSNLRNVQTDGDLP